jgi:hypothetical protein
MSVCCTSPTFSAVAGLEELYCGDDASNTSCLPTAGVAFASGDLVNISAANVITLATAAGVFDGIMAYPLTAAQATSHAAAGVSVAVYNQGEFRVDQVSLAGVKLTAANFQAAIARGAKINIELRIPA